MSSRRGSHSSWWKQRSADGQGQQRKQFSGGNWWGVSPLIYGCELPPDPNAVYTLPHKAIRILRRLKKGVDQLVHINGDWRWVKGRKLLGYLRAGVVEAMQAAGYIYSANSRWLITTAGLAAVGATATDSARLIAAAGRIGRAA